MVIHGGGGPMCPPSSALPAPLWGRHAGLPLPSVRQPFASFISLQTLSTRWYYRVGPKAVDRADDSMLFYAMRLRY